MRVRLRRLRPHFVFTCCASVVFLASCAHPIPHPTTTPFTQTDQLRIALIAPHRVAPLLDPTPFRVLVTDNHGSPVSAVSVTLDLTMPSMSMPENPILARPMGTGVYTGIGRFTMAGDWLADITVTDGKQQETKSFPLTVK